MSIQPGPDHPRDLTDDVYKYMMTGNKEDGTRLFLQADSGKAFIFFFFSYEGGKAVVQIAQRSLHP